MNNQPLIETFLYRRLFNSLHIIFYAATAGVLTAKYHNHKICVLRKKNRKTHFSFQNNNLTLIVLYS